MYVLLVPLELVLHLLAFGVKVALQVGLERSQFLCELFEVQLYPSENFLEVLVLPVPGALHVFQFVLQNLEAVFFVRKALFELVLYFLKSF